MCLQSVGRLARGWLVWGGLSWGSSDLPMWSLIPQQADRGSSHGSIRGLIDRVEEDTGLRPKSGNGTLWLPLNIVQSKSQGQRIFKGWGNGFYLLMGGATKSHYGVWILGGVENCGYCCNLSQYLMRILRSLLGLVRYKSLFCFDWYL